MGKEALCCPVCENTWNHTRHQPVALPACGHSFCRYCLIKLHKMEGNVKCPLCRKGLECAKPEDLPPNFALLTLVDSNVEDVPQEEAVPQAVPKKTEASIDPEFPKKPDGDPKPEDDTSESKKKGFPKKMIIGAVVGGAGAVIAAPLVLGAVGFTSAGIAAGSWAASMMSSAAIANGGGIAAGSLVAVLQSAGAAGIPAAASAALGAGGAVVGATAAAGAALLEGDNKEDKPKKENSE